LVLRENMKSVKSPGYNYLFDEETGETRSEGFEAAALVIGEQAQKLFNLLKEAYPDGLSNNELSRKSGVRINAVCARIMELRCVEIGNHENLVEPLVKRADNITGVANVVWRVNPSYFTQGLVR